jgi:hypothetical protein
MSLEGIIAEIEAAGFNWETSKKGKMPDGRWHRFATVWHPVWLMDPCDGFSLESNEDALRQAFEKARS